MLKTNWVNQQQIILDTGSTHHICINRDMFIGEMKKIRGGVNLTGIGSQLPAESEGTIKISIKDDQGKLVHLVINNLLYIPASPANLVEVMRNYQIVLSTQKVL